MSLGLSAPAAVRVEVRAGDRTGDRRVFRLSAEIGMGGVLLGRPAPFEPGSPVFLRFHLPGDPLAIEVDAQVVTTGDPAESEGEAGGCALHFRDSMPAPEIRSAIAGYISDRLGLPPLPAL